MSTVSVAPLLLLVVVCISAVHAMGRGYTSILGTDAVHKYCGESNDACMFSNQCCDGYKCKFNGGFDGKCQSDASEDSDISKECTSHLDCNLDECCKSVRTGALKINRKCSKDCSSWSSNQADNWRNSAPVGNYQGYNFWNRWNRRARD